MNATFTQFVDDVINRFHDRDDLSTNKQKELDCVRKVQECYRAIGVGDFAFVVAQCDPEVEFEILGPIEVPFCGNWKGSEQLIQTLVRNFAMVEDQQPVIQSVIAQGDCIVIIARETGRWFLSRETYDWVWIQYFRFQNGKLIQIREFLTPPPGEAY
jgi:ketosteroid isomerase-like protein